MRRALHKGKSNMNRTYEMQESKIVDDFCFFNDFQIDFVVTV